MPLASATVPFPIHHPIASSMSEYTYGSGRTLQSYMSWADYIFRDLGLIISDPQHLESTVRLALQAQEFFFAAALHHPDGPQLDYFFKQFINLAALPTPPPAKRLC